jgi:ABC-type transport system involved in Fe-S cluster assembly fused permease/ATPase subunit
MDEGTSALDRTIEKLVQKNIDIDMKNKTSINIAHR